jgi:hypothetical protein
MVGSRVARIRRWATRQSGLSPLARDHLLGAPLLSEVDMSHRVRWAVGMTVLGVVVAVCVDAVTGSIGWAFVALLAAGMVANLVARPAPRR